MKQKHSMDSLRKEGYKVRCTHFRYTQHGLFSNLQIRQDNEKGLAAKHVISPRGGKVIVKITTPQDPNPGEPTYEFEGVSNCSVKDNFVRKIGTAIAFGRAVQDMKANSNYNEANPD